MEASSERYGVSGTVIRPRVGRSRSKVTRRSIVTSAAAISIGKMPRPSTARMEPEQTERGRGAEHLEREYRVLVLDC